MCIFRSNIIFWASATKKSSPISKLNLQNLPISRQNVANLSNFFWHIFHIFVANFSKIWDIKWQFFCDASLRKPFSKLEEYISVQFDTLRIQIFMYGIWLLKTLLQHDCAVHECPFQGTNHNEICTIFFGILNP